MVFKFVNPKTGPGSTLSKMPRAQRWVRRLRHEHVCVNSWSLRGQDTTHRPQPKGMWISFRVTDFSTQKITTADRTFVRTLRYHRVSEWYWMQWSHLVTVFVSSICKCLYPVSLGHWSAISSSFFKKIFISFIFVYLAAPCLSCDMQDL